MNDWFTVESVDATTYIISEYRHWEETHCYLLIGETSALLIDTGLGIANIREQVDLLTEKPVAAIASHVHWDHIGGHKHFSDILVHKLEEDWLNGSFPLPVQAVRKMLSKDCRLPDAFCLDTYELFQGEPGRVLEDAEEIDLGKRYIKVLHTPGHAPGHMCFWEEERGYLFSGDLVYEGTLYANYPSTDPQKYLESLEKIAALPVRRLFPGHHNLDIKPELIPQITDVFRALQKENKLYHGSGKFDAGSFRLML